MNAKAKKGLFIFLLIAYGITFLMFIPMKLGLDKGIDLTAFANVQMMYPAAGVMLAKMMTKEKGEKLPIAGYVIFLIGMVIMMALALLSIFFPIGQYTGMDFYNLISQLVILPVSIVTYILFWVCSREAKENAGVTRKNIGRSIGFVVLFLVLYFSRFAIGTTLSGLLGDGVANAWSEWINTIKGNLVQEIALIFSLPINFVFTYAAFFGEEYGWRYYLQPVMQKKFGTRNGVLLLGLVWAVWHIGVDYMFYTKDSGFMMFVSQIVTCVSIGIFFGYAYMKTQNIWVPVIMHYLNNNLILVLAGTTDTSVLQNQSVAWSDIPIAIVQSLVFVLFILAKEFRKNPKPAEIEAAAQPVAVAAEAAAEQAVEQPNE